LGTTCGHPGHWNDKTLVLFDQFVSGVYKGTIYSDIEYDLYEKNVDGEIQKMQYKGAWIIVDNGYLNWPTMIPPYKHTTFHMQLRWSQWIESLRKDVQCTFGILKGHF